MPNDIPKVIKKIPIGARGIKYDVMEKLRARKWRNPGLTNYDTALDPNDGSQSAHFNASEAFVNMARNNNLVRIDIDDAFVQVQHAWK